jgi:hypothetical protein
MATPPVFSSGAVLTAAQMNAVGMWKITEASTIGASLSISNCFTSDFKNYRIVWNIDGATNLANLVFRWRLNTTDQNAFTYYYGFNENTAAATAFVGFSGANGAIIGRLNDNAFYPSNGSFEVGNPLLGRVQGGTFTYIEQNATITSGQGGFNYTTTGAWNGFSLICSSGVASITAAVYGYRKA